MKINSLISKQTTLFLIGLLTLSTLFLPLTTLRAATLTNGMDAAYVLGQDDFISNSFSGYVDSSELFAPSSLYYDDTNNRLFVSQNAQGAVARIHVFEFDPGITNGMTASYVLGDPSFTTFAASSVSAGGLFGGVSITDIAYDPDNDYLFATDGYHDRVIVWDLSGGITNGMDATYVLGQPDLTTSNNSTTSINGFTDPRNIYYDNSHDRLFVGDGNGVNSGARILVFDLSSGITNGMDASYVIGSSSFTERVETTSISGFGQSTYGMTYDSVNDFLFVGDPVNRRIMVFDLSGGITNGMDASYVLGQPDFTSNDFLGAGFEGSLFTSLGIHYEESNQLLFATDMFTQRVLIFDLSGGITNGMAGSYALGQPSLTTGTVSGLSRNEVNSPWGVDYDPTGENLFVSDSANNRILIFNLTPTLSTGKGYIHPPLCTATFSPNEVTQGQSTTLSWTTTWPTNKTNTYYTKVPQNGLYSSKVHAITLEPQHTTTYRIAMFNLWGATFCEDTITVLDDQGNEILPPHPTQQLLSASAGSSPLARTITSFFARLFTW